MVYCSEEIVLQVLDTIQHLAIAIMPLMFNAHQLKNKHQLLPLSTQIQKKKTIKRRKNFNYRNKKIAF
jgi:hypothetical protein